jgi:hypothetical protein
MLLDEESGDDTNPMPEQGNHIPAAELIRGVKLGEGEYS